MVAPNPPCLVFSGLSPAWQSRQAALALSSSLCHGDALTLLPATAYHGGALSSHFRTQTPTLPWLFSLLAAMAAPRVYRKYNIGSEPQPLP